MTEIYEFKLIFEYDKGKPMEFKYRIEREDYETFYSIIDSFFTDELDEEYCKPIKKHYPKIRSKSITNHTFGQIFERDFVMGGIQKISNNTYKIQWCT